MPNGLEGKTKEVVLDVFHIGDCPIYDLLSENMKKYCYKTKCSDCVHKVKIKAEILYDKPIISTEELILTQL